MFILLVYDINVKRVNKVLKKCREYLTWVQNSVFEGELTPAQFRLLKNDLKGIIKKDEDSVMFYTFKMKSYLTREILGIEKGSEENIL